MSEQLDRKRIPICPEFAQKMKNAPKTYEAIKLPISARFAYWMGKNGYKLRQKHRIDDVAREAYERGCHDFLHGEDM